MSMMHRRRMVIERAKKLNQQTGEQHHEQGQNSNGPIQEGQQGGQNRRAQGRKKGGA